MISQKKHIDKGLDREKKTNVHSQMRNQASCDWDPDNGATDRYDVSSSSIMGRWTKI